MNRTPIEWIHPDPKRRFSSNPMTGCLTGCGYCYARAYVHRFYERGARTGNLVEVAQPGEVYPYGFAPTFYPHRLEEPARKKEPVGIFMVSMGDLFGPWVPWEWRANILKVTEEVPWHSYYLLTKHPSGFGVLAFPDNCRVGVTVTREDDLWRQHALILSGSRRRFVSYEPLLGPIEMGRPMPGNPSWLIVGALTRNGRTVPPEQGGTRREWVEDLVAQADAAGLPVFMKNNLAPLFPGERLRQEWPHA